MAVLPNNRIGVVAAEINKVFQTIVAHDLTRRDAQGAANAASQNSMNAREAALVSLAALAETDRWSRYDVDEGVAKALSGRNAKSSTLASFASEIKRACQAKVRPHVAELSKLAGDVWQAESEGEGAKPCRKAFSRRYHMLQRMLGEAADGRVFTTAPEVIGWALANDPDLDYAKVFKRLKAIREQLRAFSADFPVEGLTTCVEFMTEITLDELKACRERANAPSEPEGAAADEPPPANDPEPADGVVDLDTFLRDALADQKAA